MPYSIFYKSVQGASHIKRNMPCEDYGIADENDLCRVFALGDGHGDCKCFRSQKGSELVCKIATEQLKMFAAALHDNQRDGEMLNPDKSERLIKQLINSIIGSWYMSVDNDLKNNPVTEEELSQAKECADMYRSGLNLQHIYGTTFIGGLMTEKYLLLLQQGDGRCVVFDENGEPSQPIPWDERCLSNVTTSVCDSDAAQSCRYTVINLEENSVIAVVAGSDGVEDSFNSMDRMHSYLSGTLLSYACKNGVDAFTEYLETELVRLNTEGSGDDTTVCGFVDLERTSCFINKFEMRNKIVSVDAFISSYNDRLTSMEGKYNFLKEKYSESENGLSESEKTFFKYINKSCCKLISWTMPDGESSVKINCSDFPGGCTLKSVCEDVLYLAKREKELLIPLQDSAIKCHKTLPDEQENFCGAFEELEGKARDFINRFFDNFDDLLSDELVNKAKEKSEEYNRKIEEAKKENAERKYNYNEGICELAAALAVKTAWCNGADIEIKKHALSDDEYLGNIRNEISFIADYSELVKKAADSEPVSEDMLDELMKNYSERDNSEISGVVSSIRDINTFSNNKRKFHPEFSSYEAKYIELKQKIKDRQKEKDELENAYKQYCEENQKDDFTCTDNGFITYDGE